MSQRFKNGGDFNKLVQLKRMKLQGIDYKIVSKPVFLVFAYLSLIASHIKLKKIDHFVFGKFRTICKQMMDNISDICMINDHGFYIGVSFNFPCKGAQYSWVGKIHYISLILCHFSVVSLIFLRFYFFPFIFVLGGWLTHLRRLCMATPLFLYLDISH